MKMGTIASPCLRGSIDESATLCDLAPHPTSRREEAAAAFLTPFLAVARGSAVLGPGNRRWGSLSTVGGDVGPASISEDLAPEDAYSRLERLDRETFKCNMAL